MNAETLSNIERRVASAGNDLALVWPDGKILVIGKPEDIERIRRANLLIRCERFRRDYLKMGLLMEKYIKNKKVSKTYWSFWEEFLSTWHLHGWAANFSGLHFAMNDGPEIFIKEFSGRISKIGYRTNGKRGYNFLSENWGTHLEDIIREDPAFILLRLTPRTGIKDLQGMWHIVERYKNRVWKVSERRKQTFGRDLMLFDLHYQSCLGRLSYGHLAERQKMTKGTVQHACDRIKAGIEQLARVHI